MRGVSNVFARSLSLSRQTKKQTKKRFACIEPYLLKDYRFCIRRRQNPTTSNDPQNKKWRQICFFPAACRTRGAPQKRQEKKKHGKPTVQPLPFKYLTTTALQPLPPPPAHVSRLRSPYEAAGAPAQVFQHWTGRCNPTHHQRHQAAAWYSPKVNEYIDRICPKLSIALPPHHIPLPWGSTS